MEDPSNSFRTFFNTTPVSMGPPPSTAGTVSNSSMGSTTSDEAPGLVFYKSQTGDDYMIIKAGIATAHCDELNFTGELFSQLTMADVYGYLRDARDHWTKQNPSSLGFSSFDYSS